MALWVKLYQLYAIFWRKRFYLLIPIITMPVIGYFVGRSIPESYHSHTSILLQESALLNPFLSELSQPFNIQSRFKAIDILVKRKQVLLEVAQQVGLIMPNDSAWQQQQVVNKIRQSLKLSLTGAELIKIEMIWPDPRQLSVILDVVSERFILRLTKPNQEQALTSQAFLAKQLNQQYKVLRQAEQNLFDYQLKNASIIPELYEARESALVDINRSLENKAQELALFQSKLTLLTKRLILTNPAAQLIDNKITQLETLKVQQLMHYTEQHSQVKSTHLKIARLQEQRQRLQSSIQSQQGLDLLLNRITRLTQQALTTQVTPLLLAQLDGYERYRNSIKKITLELKTLEKQQQYFQQNQAKYVKIELELQRLKREHDAKNTVYLDLLTRHEMVSISNALGEFESATNIKIITRPFIPEQTINLPIISYILLGLLLGIIQGTAISVALSTTQDTLWDESKIAHEMGLKIIARVPLISLASGR
ncbi:MAG: polysaccharide export protein [Moritella sp.]|nr:MAG: polysaccharide export protein [Moritella sp.]